MNKTQLRNKISEYKKKYPQIEFVRWNNCNIYKWEYELLRDSDCISYKGILRNYPIIKIQKSNGETIYKDGGGDLLQVKNQIELLTSNNQTATLEYSAGRYDNYRKLKSEIDYENLNQEIAEKKTADEQLNFN